jgi:hypothetical protein
VLDDQQLYDEFLSTKTPTTREEYRRKIPLVVTDPPAFLGLARTNKWKPSI